MKLKVGSKVEWKWLGRAVKGVVQEIHSKPIIKEIKGKKIKRNGSADNPAQLVESEAGNLALKLHQELQASQIGTKLNKPKMFTK